MGDRLIEVVKSHLRANGDWNINDWRDVAAALAYELQQIEGRVRELEAERDMVLTHFYVNGNAPAVARLCDEVLDPHGALLGRIRFVAHAAKAASGEEQE